MLLLLLISRMLLLLFISRMLLLPSRFPCCILATPLPHTALAEAIIAPLRRHRTTW